MKKLIIIIALTLVAFVGCKKDRQVLTKCPTITDRNANLVSAETNLFHYYFKLSSGEIIQVDKQTWDTWKMNQEYTPKCVQY